jgi:hypothetical protein
MTAWGVQSRHGYRTLAVPPTGSWCIWAIRPTVDS